MTCPPPRFELPGYLQMHRPGHHCGTAAMGNLLRYHTQLPWSEAWLFGLSGAIWFCLVVPPLSGFELPLGRTIDLEESLCSALGLAYREQLSADEEAWPRARDALLEGTPVVLMGDCSRLDYFGGPPFPGHRFVLVGYDDDQSIALVGDRLSRKVQRLPYASLSRARSVPDDLLSAQNLWGIPQGSWRVPLSELEARRDAALRPSLERAAHRMLEDTGTWTGVRGIHSFAEHVRGLDDAALARAGTACEFVLERGGNGGGFFRRMYAQFLREAAPQLGPEAIEISDRFQQLGDEWTRLAGALGAMARAAVPCSHAGEIAERIHCVAETERGLWSRLMGI